MMVAALFSLVSSYEPSLLMPPLERLAQTLSIVIISWAFLVSSDAKRGVRANLLLTVAIILILILFAHTVNEWFREFETDVMFNASDLAPIWSGLTVAIGLFGFLAALFNIGRIVDAPLKCLFFLLVVLGNGWDTWQFVESGVTGSYLGSARWAYLAALALVPVVIHRHFVAALEHGLNQAIEPTSQPRSVHGGAVAPGPGLDALIIEEPDASAQGVPSQGPVEQGHLVRALGMMMDTRENSGIPQQVVATALELLDAEVCMLLRIEGEDYANIIAGLDAVTGKSLDDMTLNLGSQPTLVDAAMRREQRILEPDQHSQEVEALFRSLNVGATGTVYVQPISVNDEVLALMLACMPYRQREFSRQQRAVLGDLCQMAGHILAWSFDAEAAAFLAEEHAIQSILDRVPSRDDGSEMREKARRELAASLEDSAGQIVRRRLQIADLRAQLHNERIALLNNLSDRIDDVAVSQQITTVFDEQSQLMERCGAHAKLVLDAETVVQVYSAVSDDALAQVIREYAQKTQNLQSTVCDQLRRQINNLRAQNESISATDPNAILEQLSAETRQLEMEREQLQRRLTAIVTKLRTLGVEVELSSMTQVLIQLYAERKALKRGAAEIWHERDILASENAKLVEGDGRTHDVLQHQLKRLSADHDSLLNLREEMRRDYQDILERFESRDNDNRELESRIRNMQAQLETGAQQRTQLQRGIAGLSSERDNLLRIRDQLTARLAESLSESAESSGEAALRARLQELHDTVSLLNEQREKLTLELGDVQAALTAAHQVQLEKNDQSEGATSANRLADMEETFGLVRAIQAPLTAISECTDILLKESIGILGAAQHEVLQRVSLNLGRLTDMLEELMSQKHDDHVSFVLSYEEVDLVELLDETVNSLSANIREKRLALELTVDDDLPRIAVDPDCIKQVLLHLLRNACDVSAEGAPVLVTVALVSMQSPERDLAVETIRISIKDYGGGISANDLPRVFARKYLHENPKIEGLSDTGVGMTVARAFARAHAGDLWIDSKAGEGSVFHLALPTRLMPTVEE